MDRGAQRARPTRDVQRHPKAPTLSTRRREPSGQAVCLTNRERDSIYNPRLQRYVNPICDHCNDPVLSGRHIFERVLASSVSLMDDIWRDSRHWLIRGRQIRIEIEVVVARAGDYALGCWANLEAGH